MGKQKKKLDDLTPEQSAESKIAHRKNQMLVEFYLKDVKNCNWPNEIKLAKYLFSLHPDFDFWTGMEYLKNRLNTLVFFKRIDGIKAIELQKKKYSFEFPPIESFKIEDKKFGEDREIKKNPSILEQI